MSNWQAVRAALRLLNRRDRRILGLLIAVQFALALLDLAAVILIGLVAALSAASVSGEIPGQVGQLLDFAGLSDTPTLTTALVIAVLAGLLFITKSILSFLVMRRSYRFLASRQAIISGKLAALLFSKSILQTQKRSSQETSYALVQGANAATLGVLGGAVVVSSEAVLVTVLFIAVLGIDPVVAIFAVAFFALVALLLHRVLSGWAAQLGRGLSESEIASIAAVQESLRTYREVSVTYRRGFFVERFRGLRWRSAGFQADLQIMSQVSKYVFEVALVIGAALLAYSQFVTKDIVAAVSVIAVFLAATSRITPALLRLQGALLQMRSAGGIATTTFQLAEELLTDGHETWSADERSAPQDASRDSEYPGFRPALRVESVTFTYPGAEAPAVLGSNINVAPGTSLALVGPTGAGKSTLVDLILGILTPDEGRVLLADAPPSETVARWPGAVAYVPQDTAVIAGSVRTNVAIGLPPELVDDDAVWRSLEAAQLADFFRHEREGLDTVVGEHGVRLSGGQRQRLGLARALYSSPRFLVLDEATSALDAETEVAITSALEGLGAGITRIVIAHRLATVRDCEQVAYIHQGRIEHVGTFEEVRSMVPNFDRQAQLLGL